MITKQIRVVLPLLLVVVLLLPGSGAAGDSSLPILVGVYPPDSVYESLTDLNALQTYMGQPAISIAGTFLDFESPNWLIIIELSTSWENGYIPFVNLGAGTVSSRWTAQQIADGAIDSHIRRWARTYKTLVGDGNRRAFLAPLQETNGSWVTYYGDPPNYIRAYLRIRQIFLEEGVRPESVSWVFAPNGWSLPGDEFEKYYPGHSVVDAVGFSSFNPGSCFTWSASQSYEEIYKPYLERMAAMAPGKPIFVAEIGSVAEGLDRAAWFNDTLTKIGNFPGVRAIIYFDRDEDPNNYLVPEWVLCHPVTYQLNSNGAEGKAAFRAKVTSAPYGYWAPDSTEMLNIAFSRPAATFEDVWPASAFSGRATTPYYQPWVEKLVAAQITGGCSINVVNFDGVTDYTYRYYCPNNPVNRAQMAVFLEKGIKGASFSPPPATGLRFGDVPATHWAAAWIEQLANDGVTGGCGGGNYCPEAPVTRGQMAVFLLKAKYGALYTPPPLDENGTGFSDVPADYWSAAWIKQLAEEGITGGCGGGKYCPNNPVTRGQMAVFLAKTFNLP